MGGGRNTAKTLISWMGGGISIIISEFYKKKCIYNTKITAIYKINVKKIKAHHIWNGNWIRQNDVIYIWIISYRSRTTAIVKVSSSRPNDVKMSLRTFSSQVAVAGRTGTSTNILRMCSTSLFAGLKSSPLKLWWQVLIKKYRVLTT